MSDQTPLKERKTHFWKDATGRLGGVSLYFGTEEGYLKVHRKVLGWEPDMVFNADKNRWEDAGDGTVLLVPSIMEREG